MKDEFLKSMDLYEIRKFTEAIKTQTKFDSTTSYERHTLAYM